MQVRSSPAQRPAAQPSPAHGATLAPAAEPVDTFARLERSVATVSKTHQIDNLIATQWDTTRCSAASAVAMAALAGKPFVDAMAAHAEANLRQRVEAMWSLVDDLEDPAKRTEARKTLLVELARHINAFRMTMPSALFEIGYDVTREPGRGIGVPREMDETPIVIAGAGERKTVTTPSPTSTTLVITDSDAEPAKDLQWFVRDGVGTACLSKVDVPELSVRVPWSRIVTDEASGASSIALQTKDVALGPAAQVLAMFQLTDQELDLVDRVVSCLEAELVKAEGNLAAIRRTSELSAPVLQQLADSLLVVEQHSASGLNAAETMRSLEAAGLSTEALPTPIAWADLPRAVRPGEFLLLEGRGHAVMFGRLTDGRTFVYDSEGHRGERENACLRILKPGEIPEADVHYGGFVATHRVAMPEARAARSAALGDAQRTTANATRANAALGKAFEDLAAAR